MVINIFYDEDLTLVDTERIVKEGCELPGCSFTSFFTGSKYYMYNGELYKLKASQYEKYEETDKIDKEFDKLYKNI